jgi:hypothetical protein
MHIFIVVQPTIETSLWLRFWARSWTKLPFWEFLSPPELWMRIVNSFLTKAHLWGIFLGYYPETLRAVLVLDTLPIYCFERVIPRLFAGIVHSCSTLSKSDLWGIQCNFEGIVGSLVAINCFQCPLLDWYVLEAYFTLHSLDSPCAVDLVVHICYLGKPPLIIPRPLGRLLLSITIHWRERKLIARLVNFLLTSESMQSMSYPLGEAYLKVSLIGWWALLNSNLSLNYAD